jgi:sugar phosphate isomerase/epimerase
MMDVEIQLPANCRGRFPFRLATTSFIVPADYLPNVRALAPWFDEIELLFFEAAENFPAPELVSALTAARDELGIGYNVHLPVDLPLCHANIEVRRQAALRMGRIIKALSPLEASTATLHLNITDDQRRPAARKRWQAHAAEAAARILEASGVPGRWLSVETLDYPLEWLADPIEALDLGVCLDFGHLALAGVDRTAAYRQWAPRCDILHLHAVRGGRDHHPLDCLQPEEGAGVRDILAEFAGTVSLEVFSLPALRRSVAWLARVNPDQWPAVAGETLDPKRKG